MSSALYETISHTGVFCGLTMAQERIMMDTTTGRPELGAISRLHQPVWYWSIAFLLSGFYVVSSLYISAHRLLWYDEILTAISSRQPTVRTMLDSLGSLDAVPPLYFLITRLFYRAFHHSDFALRIPSALALGAGMMVTFDIARRLTDGLYGLIAMSLATTSLLVYYGSEARPYSLCYLIVAIALWLWVFTKDESKGAAAAFGCIFLIGVALHYYVVLYLLPFGISALSRRRFFHPKLIAAALGAMCSLLTFYSQIERSRAGLRAGSIPSWAPPSIAKLQGVYWEFFSNAVLPLVLLVIGVVVFGKARKHLMPPMGFGEHLGWLFLTVPLAGFVLAEVATNYFHNRYFIGAIPALAVAATCLLWRHWLESNRVSLALLVAFAGFGLFQQVRVLRSIDHIPAFGDHQERTRQMLTLQDTLRQDGKRIFAFTSMMFLEPWYYSKHPEEYAFVRFHPGSLKHYDSIRFLSVDEVVANARQIALVDPEPDLVEALRLSGLHLTIRHLDYTSPQYIFYLE
jgi:mannosyltransferase